MVKELSAQEAKDLAYKYQDNEEVYGIAKNLEDVLDGTRDHDNRTIERLESKLDDAESEAQEYEDKYSRLEDEVKDFLNDLEEKIAADDFNKEEAIKEIRKFMRSL